MIGDPDIVVDHDMAAPVGYEKGAFHPAVGGGAVGQLQADHRAVRIGEERAAGPLGAAFIIEGLGHAEERDHQGGRMAEMVQEPHDRRDVGLGM